MYDANDFLLFYKNIKNCFIYDLLKKNFFYQEILSSLNQQNFELKP